MATVLIHLNVHVPDDVAKRSEEGAVAWAKAMVTASFLQGTPFDVNALDEFIAMAEVVDYDHEEEM